MKRVPSVIPSMPMFAPCWMQDLMTNPLIVPVKILRGHKVVEHQGVLDCVFHPTQPWIFSAGGDARISLYTN